MNETNQQQPTLANCFWLSLILLLPQKPLILDFEHQRQGKDDREFPSFTFPGMSDRFLGNHTHTDYFKLLRQDGDSLVIGARNVIYNITIDGLVENREQVRIKEEEMNESEH